MFVKRVENVGIGGRAETMKTTEESWRSGETCCHFDSCERPSGHAGVKNSLS